MAASFPIIHVDPDSIISDEPLGSKKKFWFLHEDQRWLFKEARANTGEDWAEKIAAELAHLLNVNAAEVELAACEGRIGAASRSFVHHQDEDLVHGNEILAGFTVGYDRGKRLHQYDHTFDNIANAVRRMVEAEPIYQDALSVLASYLVLDALICNTDRHHENWGFLMRPEPKGPGHRMIHLEVAPSFDHASSLGRGA